jgi:hypothetical protein
MLDAVVSRCYAFINRSRSECMPVMSVMRGKRFGAAHVCCACWSAEQSARLELNCVEWMHDTIVEFVIPCSRLRAACCCLMKSEAPLEGVLPVPARRMAGEGLANAPGVR